MSQQYNLIHASENAEIAEKEVKLLFNSHELFEWKKTDLDHVYLPEEKK